MKHIICYSGGHSSAIVAIEVTRRYGKENVVLINHECKLEPDDVSRFENEVAEYLGMHITYVNMPNSDTKDQFDVAIEAGMFVYAHHSRQIVCTTVMKTHPFNAYLNAIHSDKDCIIYYGFDKKEIARIQRRSTILSAQGFKSDFPLALWNDRTIHSTIEIGINPPNSYGKYKHANCKGCLKAGWQHWYIIYVDEPEIYKKGMYSESEIGYSIHRDKTLEEMIPKFELMIKAGIEPTEHIQSQTFWANVRKKLKCFDDVDLTTEAKPCECFF